MDTLSSVIERLALSANTFFSGTLCDTSDFASSSDTGHLHLVRKGQLALQVDGEPPQPIEKPSVILFSPTVKHQLHVSENSQVEIVCAEIKLAGESNRFLPLGLPNPLLVRLEEAMGLESILELLFAESVDKDVGADAAINRLMELLFVLLLRHGFKANLLQPGMLAGLAHPQLAKALLAMHASPGLAWNLDQLAATAAMSRARFAAQFKDCVGVPPGEYLTTLRIIQTQAQLKLGRPLKSIAADVGYADATALARVFKQFTGMSPRAWLSK